MTGGHVMLATILGFAGSALYSMTHGGGFGGNGIVFLISAAGVFAITFLELFVAVLQAFVFMFLIAVFISLMDHHDEHGHEHEHGHAPGHEHAHA
jgi:F0F1-type ATP synthase membrane subunit a